MARSDGFLSNKKEKTRILPLRWIGNICGGYAGNHLVKCFDYDEENRLGFAYKYHAKMWTILNKPYEKWGTYYLIDTEAMKKAWGGTLTDGESQDS